MSRRNVPLLAFGALCAVSLAPGAARADLRIEERSTTLDSTVSRWTSIQGVKRVIVTKADVTGAIYNAGAKYGAYVEIARPDKEVIWDIDPQERSFRELTADQFSKLLQRGIQPPRTANEQPLRSLYNSQTTAIEVAPTGKTKRIAGYEAEQVMARMVVGAVNRVSGNQFNFTFDQEIWLTKDEGLLGKLRACEVSYEEAFGTAATLQQAQVLAGPWNDAFIQHLRAMNDRVRALKGYPLASITTVTEEAVAQAKGEKSTSRKFTVATNEVRSISRNTLPERDFELPAGYVNSDTKVAVAAPLPTPSGAPAGQPEKLPVTAALPKPVDPAVPAGPGQPDKPVAIAANPGAPAEVPPVSVAKADPPSSPTTIRTRSTAPRVTASSPAYVTGTPTNVIVQGPKSPPSASGTGERSFVQGYAPPPIRDNYPVLGGGLAMMTRGAPSAVTVDEPELTPKRGKKKKSRIPLF